MLSKSQIRFITSLHHKKYRQEHQCFIVEGIKSVMEFIHSDYVVNAVYSTSGLAPKLGKIPQKIKFSDVSDADMQRISTLKTPQGVLAVVSMPTLLPLEAEKLAGHFTLMLDDVQDPGTLGTIIRTAEWFGFERIVCSLHTAEAYNPKVVQASMGSLARMKVHYADIESLITDAIVPVYGAVLDGRPIYDIPWGEEGVILLGNEGNGIRQSLLGHIQHPVTIPRVGRAESLNVAVSAALFCSEIVRSKTMWR